MRGGIAAAVLSLVRPGVHESDYIVKIGATAAVLEKHHSDR
jgi:hypothetical protein